MFRRFVQRRVFFRLVENSRCTRFITHGPKVLFSNFDRDLPNPSLPTPMKVSKHDTDLLLIQLKKATSVEKILEIASNHLDVMNAQHMVTCLESVHEALKHTDMNGKTLLENQLFQDLCSRLMKIVRHLTPDDLICVYKVMNNLGVRNNTYIMQSVLKMIGGHLNNLNLSQLTFLSFLLSKQRHNSLVDGLRLAIPLVLQVQIEQQLDSDKINEIVDALHLACKSRLKPSTIQKIVETVLHKAKLLSPMNAVTVIFALLHLETPMDGYRELINYSFELVSKNIDVLDYQQILPLLRLCRSENFYNDRFYFSVSCKIVKNKWNLEHTWRAANSFKRVGFCPQEFVNYFTEVVCKESEAFITDAVYSPLTLVEYLTINGNRPQNLTDVLKLACSVEKKIAAMSESPLLLLKFVSCLAMLGHFHEELLSKVVDEEFLFSTWSKSRKIGRKAHFEESAMSLLWSLELHDKQDRFPFPRAVSRSLTQAVCEQNANRTFPLQKFIENGLGGSQFLRRGVLTQDGLFIDHVLGMRSGNYPVSLSTTISTVTPGATYVDDFSLPTDAKMVAVIVAYREDYCRDPEVLTGWMDLKVKSLTKKGLYPVVINISTWQALPDREKIPYLMREIKQAAEVEDCERKDTVS